uniref:Uncharacterized protein n=1 Tax=Plectus sambesii TaxID=2011161 RepID=A0A914V4B5_9BILA
TLSNDVDAPLWVLLITSSIAGVTGNVTIATLTGMGHIGDTTTDKSLLPVAATAAMSVATMFGGFVEAAMSDLPSAWPCVVSIACAAAGLFCALILLPNAPPVAQAVTPLRVTSTQDGFCSKVADGFMSFLKDTGSVFAAVARKREGNKRGMLIALCATIFLVSAVIDDEDVVIQTYLVGEPFCWDKEKFGLFSGIKSGM